MPVTGWLQKVVNGIQSFAITEAELNDGITAEQFMQGLVFDRENGRFDWIERDVPEPTPVVVHAPAGVPSAPAPVPQPAPTVETAPVQATRRLVQVEEGPAMELEESRRQSPLSQLPGVHLHDSSLLAPPTPATSRQQEVVDGMRHAQGEEDGMAHDK